MPAFELSKWYLDCITESGDVSIIYSGTAKWGPAQLRYSSLIESAAQTVTTRHSLRPSNEPKLDNGLLSWQSVKLKTAGEWRPDSVAVRKTIYSSKEGAIEWNCLMPRAHARIGNRVGLGYAEHLSMTIAPWRLPLRTLRWGRFLSPSDWIVWIDWLGDFTQRTVYRNGEMAQTLRLDDREIEFCDGGKLSLDLSLVLREGPLGVTALSQIPGIRSSFPARLLNINECKWRSRARYERAGSTLSEGWAVHERVEWPK